MDIKIDNFIWKDEKAQDVDCYKERNEQGNKPAMLAKVYPVVENNGERGKRGEPKKRVKAKGGGEVEAQECEPCARDAAAGAGDAEKIFDGAAGAPSAYIVQCQHKQQK